MAELVARAALRKQEADVPDPKRCTCEATGECLYSMSGPTCRVPNCPPCQYPDFDHDPDCPVHRPSNEGQGEYGVSGEVEGRPERASDRRDSASGLPADPVPAGPAEGERAARAEKYGDGWTIWVEPAPVRMVEMGCCGFSFDAGHTDQDGGYTCPLCAPSQQPGEETRALREAVAEIASWSEMRVEHALWDRESGLRSADEARGRQEAFDEVRERLARALSTPEPSEETRALVAREIARWLRHIDRFDELPNARLLMPKHNVLWDAANAIEARFAESVSGQTAGGEDG